MELRTSRYSPAVTTTSGVASSASGSVRTAAAGMPSGRSRASQPSAVSVRQRRRHQSPAPRRGAPRARPSSRSRRCPPRPANEPPESVVGDEQRQIAVGGRKQLRRNVVRVRTVRVALRLDAVVEIGRRPVVQLRQHHVAQRHVDLAAAAGHDLREQTRAPRSARWSCRPTNSRAASAARPDHRSSRRRRWRPGSRSRTPDRRRRRARSRSARRRRSSRCGAAAPRR